MLEEEALTHSIIGAFFEVYNRLGYGFREHIYSLALERELLQRGHRVAREVWFPVFYRGERLAHERADIVVDDRVVVENKARRRLRRSDYVQLRSYLRSSYLNVGLLFHYGIEPKFFRAIATGMGGSEQQPGLKGAEGLVVRGATRQSAKSKRSSRPGAKQGNEPSVPLRSPVTPLLTDPAFPPDP
jgi:GxxExxY protein